MALENISSSLNKVNAEITKASFLLKETLDDAEVQVDWLGRRYAQTKKDGPILLNKINSTACKILDQCRSFSKEAQENFEKSKRNIDRLHGNSSQILKSSNIFKRFCAWLFFSTQNSYEIFKLTFLSRMYPMSTLLDKVTEASKQDNIETALECLEAVVKDARVDIGCLGSGYVNSPTNNTSDSLERLDSISLKVHEQIFDIFEHGPNDPIFKDRRIEIGNFKDRSLELGNKIRLLKDQHKAILARSPHKRFIRNLLDKIRPWFIIKRKTI